jgi:hypothetical protein
VRAESAFVIILAGCWIDPKVNFPCDLIVKTVLQWVRNLLDLPLSVLLHLTFFIIGSDPAISWWDGFLVGVSSNHVYATRSDPVIVDLPPSDSEHQPCE